jgi:hypothetical protein
VYLHTFKKVVVCGKSGKINHVKTPSRIEGMPSQKNIARQPAAKEGIVN